MKHPRLIKVLALAIVFCLVCATVLADSPKITLRLLTRWSGADPMTPLLKEIAKEFMASNPNVTIVDESVAEEASYNNKFKAYVATGNLPNVFYFPGMAGMIGYAKAGLLMNIAPLLKDKAWADGFINGSFSLANFGKYGVKGVYGVPIQNSPEVMYYNAELFAKAGIKKAPQTMDELYAAIEQLKAANIIPWGCGARDTWRTGHIHNNLIYKVIGVDGVKNLGARKAKWTDAGVVESLRLLKNLKERGAFEKNFEGINYDTERAGFLSGKYAMTCNGSWFVSDVVNSNSPYKDKIKFFAFPYLKEKPKYKGDAVLFTQMFYMSGKVKGAEKEATIKFFKFLTSKETGQRVAAEVQQIPSRKDIDLTNAKLDPLFKDMIAYLGTIKKAGSDYFDYDQDPALIDRSRNSIIGMMLGNSPEQAAREIQDEIDKFEKNK